MWLNIPEDMVAQLLQLCEEHKPELACGLRQEVARFQDEPGHPWQKTAVEFLRSRWSRSRWSHEDEIGVDDDAAITIVEEGVFVYGWLWVSKEDLKNTMVGEVHEK